MLTVATIGCTAPNSKNKQIQKKVPSNEVCTEYPYGGSVVEHKTPATGGSVTILPTGVKEKKRREGHLKAKQTFNNRHK